MENQDPQAKEKGLICKRPKELFEGIYPPELMPEKEDEKWDKLINELF